MSIYCGTDIIEVDRIKKAIMDNPKFIGEVFSTNEIKDIEKAKNDNLKYQRYAGRFASKEAIYKALSKIFSQENIMPKFSDIEIINDESLKRRPYINVLNEKLNEIFIKYAISIDLSISHVKDNAIAMAVANIDKE